MIAIYRIRNVVNGHFYVGSTKDTRVRFQTHRRNLRKGTHHCEPLQRAWDKHTEDVFKFEVIERVDDAADLHAIENRWLAEHHGKEHCYNVSKYADAPTRGMTFSEHHKARISQSAKGKPRRLGLTNSPEHNAKISAALKGKKKSAEHVEKMRQRMIGTSYAKGNVWTDEMRAARGKPVVEMSTGMEFASLSAAAAHYGISRPNLTRALRSGGAIKRGPCAGLRFQHKDAA